MGQWSAWSYMTTCNCPKMKFAGRKHRQRSIEIKARYGGKPCEQETEKESKNCSEAEREIRCPGDVRRALSLWTEWSPCESPCLTSKGKGIKERTRVCFKPRKCKKAKLVQKRRCRAPCPAPEGTKNTQKSNFFFKHFCPVKVEWNDWGTCSVTCGVGQQTRSSKGQARKQENETLKCDMGPCNEPEDPELLEKAVHPPVVQMETKEEL